MDGRRAGDDGAGAAAAAIASAQDTWPGEGFPQTILAGLAVAEEDGTGAEQAEIVEGLNDSCAGVARGGIDGRGEQWERVVKVDDLGAMSSNGGGEVLCGGRVPESGGGGAKLTHARDGFVADAVAEDVV